MNANVGGFDRIIRIVTGLTLVGWALIDGPVWAWTGVVPLVTGIVKFCPFYPLLKINTSK